MPDCPDVLYFPAVVCGEFDSPIDALRSLCVPHDEAMDLVAASWREAGVFGIVTAIDGGRSVAAIPLAGGRWAACHAYPEHAASSRSEAERRLQKIVRGKKHGVLGLLGVRCPPLPSQALTGNLG